MGSDAMRIVIRHISGSRAGEVDVIPLGAHRELILGRAGSSAVRFDPRRDATVGRQHARIEPIESREAPGRLQIVDLGSRNGTLVNGRRIGTPAPLVAGDVVQLGDDGPRLEIHIELPMAPR